MSTGMIMFTVHFRFPRVSMVWFRGVVLASAPLFRLSWCLTLVRHWVTFCFGLRGSRLRFLSLPPSCGTSTRTNRAIVVACPVRPCCKLLPPLFFIFPAHFLHRSNFSSFPLFRSFSFLYHFFACSHLSFGGTTAAGIGNFNGPKKVQNLEDSNLIDSRVQF